MRIIHEGVFFFFLSRLVQTRGWAHLSARRGPGSGRGEGNKERKEGKEEPAGLEIHYLGPSPPRQPLSLLRLFFVPSIGYERLLVIHPKFGQIPGAGNFSSRIRNAPQAIPPLIPGATCYTQQPSPPAKAPVARGTPEEREKRNKEKGGKGLEPSNRMCADARTELPRTPGR